MSIRYQNQRSHVDGRPLLNAEWRRDCRVFMVPGMGGFSGRRMIDLSGRNNDGDFQAEPTWSASHPPGLYGSVKFDGTDDAVNLGDVYAGNLTLAAWVRIDTVAVDQRIASKWGSTDGAAVFLLSTNGATSNKITFATNESGSYAVADSASTYSAGEWVFFAGTNGDGSDIRLYWNGIEDATATSVGVPTPDATPLKLGIEGDDDSKPMDGAIAFFGLWNRPMNAREVWDLYQKSKRGFYSEFYGRRFYTAAAGLDQTRMSAVNLGLPFRGGMVNPADTGFTQGNRQASAYQYSNIAADAPGGGLSIPIAAYHYNHSLKP